MGLMDQYLCAGIEGHPPPRLGSKGRTYAVMHRHHQNVNIESVPVSGDARTPPDNKTGTIGILLHHLFSSGSGEEGAGGGTGVRVEGEEGEAALRGEGQLLRHPLGEGGLAVHAVLDEAPPAQLALHHRCSSQPPPLLPSA